MAAKFDNHNDRFSRLSVFVPDIAGPRAISVGDYIPAGAERCSCEETGGRCSRCSTPHWSR